MLNGSSRIALIALDDPWIIENRCAPLEISPQTGRITASQADQKYPHPDLPVVQDEENSTANEQV
jgi:hypothetical protein